MMQSPDEEADTFSAVQEIPPFFREPEGSLSNYNFTL
jgi:hypothetical protein